MCVHLTHPYTVGSSRSERKDKKKYPNKNPLKKTHKPQHPLYLISVCVCFLHLLRLVSCMWHFITLVLIKPFDLSVTKFLLLIGEGWANKFVFEISCYFNSSPIHLRANLPLPPPPLPSANWPTAKGRWRADVTLTVLVWRAWNAVTPCPTKLLDVLRLCRTSQGS